jgi:hypothetical protein
VERSFTPQSHSAGETIKQVVAAEYFSQIKKALIAIQETLGLLPNGISATVRARLDIIDSMRVSHTHMGGENGPKLAPAAITPQGGGSGLDADKVDGEHGSYFLNRANHTGDIAPGAISPQGTGSGLDADILEGQYGAYYRARANHTGTSTPASISPQGTGSGLDADTVDGIHASALGGSNKVCVVERTTNQTLSSGVATAITMPTEISDVENWHHPSTNTERVTPNVAGLYLVVAFVHIIDIGGSGTYFYTASIAKNGTDDAFLRMTEEQTAYSKLLPLSTVLALNGTTDYVTVKANQNTGDNLNVTGKLSVILLRAD